MPRQELTPEQRCCAPVWARTPCTPRARPTPRPPGGKSPQSLEYWAAKVDPDGLLSEAERLKRAEHARREHMIRPVSGVVAGPLSPQGGRA